MENKKADMIQKVIIQLVIIGLLFGLFFLAVDVKTSSRGVKQQVLEKQLALLVDSSTPDTSIRIFRLNRNGYINNIELKQGRVFVYVDDLDISKGYPYFSQYDVSVESDESNFYIKIKDLENP